MNRQKHPVRGGRGTLLRTDNKGPAFGGGPDCRSSESPQIDRVDLQHVNPKSVNVICPHCDAVVTAVELQKHIETCEEFRRSQMIPRSSSSYAIGSCWPICMYPV